MAKPVEEMPSNKTAPWGQYADGGTWELDTTRDLSPPTTPTRARHAAYAWGRRNGYITACRTRGQSTLYVSFEKIDGTANTYEPPEGARE